MLSVSIFVMLIVVLLSVVMLYVVMPSVVAPWWHSGRSLTSSSQG